MSRPEKEAPKKLTPEEIIVWLDNYRRLMWEVWQNSPSLKRQWEEINQQNGISDF